MVLLYIVNFIHGTNVATAGEAKAFIDRLMAQWNSDDGIY